MLTKNSFRLQQRWKFVFINILNLFVSIFFFAFISEWTIDRTQSKMSQRTEPKSQTANATDMTNDTDSHSNGKQWKLIRMIRHSWKYNGRLKFVSTALCIFVAYFIVGILQEKIMRGCYGDEVNKDCRNGERFKYAVTLVGVQSLCAFLFIKSIAISFIFYSNKQFAEKVLSADWRSITIHLLDVFPHFQFWI